MGVAAGDPDRYRYVGNAPTNATDPLAYGASATDDDAKVAGVTDGMNLPREVKAKVMKEGQTLLDAPQATNQKSTDILAHVLLFGNSPKENQSPCSGQLRKEEVLEGVGSGATHLSMLLVDYPVVCRRGYRMQFPVRRHCHS
jgi:hypothetical protein